MHPDLSKVISRLRGFSSPAVADLARLGEANFRRLIGLLPQIIWMAEANGTITYCNQYWYDYSGLTAGETAGDGWNAVLHPDDRALALRDWQEAVASGQGFTAEYRLRRASDGRYRSHIVKGSPVKKSGKTAIRWIGLAVDIHDHMMKDAELARRDEQLAVAVDMAHLGTWDFDASNDELIISHRLRDILGLGPGVVPSRESLIELVHPEDRPRIHELREQAALGKGPTDFEQELRIIRRNGEVRWVVAGGRLRYADHAMKRQFIGSSGAIQDITEQKLANQALKNNEAHLRAILENEPECVKLIDRDGCLLAMNAAGLAMIEADSLQQVVGQPMQDLVETEYRAPFQELTQKVFSGSSGVLEFKITGLKGAHRWLQTHAAPLTDKEGHVEAVLGITRDITEQKIAESALRASEARFRALIENGRDGIVLFDGEWNVIYSSSALARILGFARNEVVGKGALDFSHPDDHSQVRQRFEECLANPGKQVSVISRIRHKDGSFRLLDGVFTNLLHDPDVRGIVNNYSDITEKLQAENALRASEEKFKRAFRSSPDAITISTLHSALYIDVNDAFLRLTGWERQEVIGRTAVDLGMWVEIQDRERMLRALGAEGRVSALETCFRKKSGETIVTQLSAEVVLIEDQQCLLVITRDVTQQRAMEKQLRIAQKMEAMGQLAGGIAHDFNNLLMIMGSRAELIIQAANQPENVTRQAHEIVQAMRRAATLTRQLLAFSRDQVLQPQVLDLSCLVQELGNMLPRLIGEHIETSMVTAPGFARVRVDRGQFEQVVMNLAINARDAMPQGGHLTIQTSRVTIGAKSVAPPSQLAHGRYVLLTVSDTGVGMTQEIQARIFEPFFTTKERGRGTGLGLALVYGVVQQSGGHIIVESAAGKGTSFKIYLPEVHDTDVIGKHEQTSPTAGGSETILFVEDEDALREVGTEALRAKGYNVLMAANGADALAICQTTKHPIHLLITDMIMPRMGGAELARRVVELHPQIRVIYVSGHSGHALSGEILGNDALFLQKPFEITLLATHVRFALDREVEHNLE
jgi:PAS domain S-box-containing protein